MAGADSVGKQIAAAHTAPEPDTVARIIFASLFETGPRRVSSADKHLAVTMIRAALVELKGQLQSGQVRAVREWKDAYTAAKTELDELKLHVTICRKEGKAP